MRTLAEVCSTAIAFTIGPSIASFSTPTSPRCRHLGAMKRAVLNGSDDPTHLVRRRCISRYLTWRDHNAKSTKCPLYRFRSINLEQH